MITVYLKPAFNTIDKVIDVFRIVCHKLQTVTFRMCSTAEY